MLLFNTPDSKILKVSPDKISGISRLEIETPLDLSLLHTRHSHVTNNAVNDAVFTLPNLLFPSATPRNSERATAETSVGT